MDKETIRKTFGLASVIEAVIIVSAVIGMIVFILVTVIDPFVDIGSKLLRVFLIICGGIVLIAFNLCIVRALECLAIIARNTGALVRNIAVKQHKVSFNDLLDDIINEDLDEYINVDEDGEALDKENG